MYSLVRTAFFNRKVQPEHLPAQAQAAVALAVTSSHTQALNRLAFIATVKLVRTKEGQPRIY